MERDGSPRRNQRWRERGRPRRINGRERVRKRYYKKIGVKYFFNKVESYSIF
jgi:hypothetical protein